MTTIGIAIIGGGVIGRHHAGAIRNAPTAELVAIVDPAQRGISLAADMDVPVYADVEGMFSRENIDAVIVSTPTELHFPPTMAALDAGVHVLVEKPIMATSEQAEQVVAKSEEHGLHVLVGHHRRYYPQVREARHIVRSGRLGKLVAVSGQWGVRKHASYYEEDWRRKREAGPVLTNLIHEMDCLRYICGEVESLSAELSHGVLDLEKEDAAAMVMRFRNGALGTFVVSDQSSSPWAWEFATGETRAFPRSAQNAVRFMGTDAALDFPNLVLWHHGNDTPDWHHAMQSTEYPFALIDAFANQIAHFCAVINGDESPCITARDGTETLRTTLAVFESARSGGRVVL